MLQGLPGLPVGGRWLWAVERQLSDERAERARFPNRERECFGLLFRRQRRRRSRIDAWVCGVFAAGNLRNRLFS